MIHEEKYAKFFGWVPHSSAMRQKSQVTNVTSYAHYFTCCYGKTNQKDMLLVDYDGP